MPSRTKGFTLIELLMTLAVLTILLAIAAPSMASLKTRSASTATHNLLMASFAAARLHAVSHRHLTTICPGSTESGCRSDGVWSEGWFVFVDRNDNGRMDSGDELVRSEGAIPAGLHAISGQGRPRATFRPTGLAGGTNLTLRICADGAAQSAVILSNTGRARAATTGELAVLPGCG